ncbi:MAG TPA: polyhydroxyalkanoate granule-associated phasin [Candidatus Cybelea sp.]|nr:polyhydroxyalkanoate granule-associated phasin [Candidatus Cybelea sp.]
MEQTMPVRRTRSSKAAKQAVELAFAVPQVVAHRMSRIAAAGTTPSARDQREFWTMGFEKVVAFNQSWWAMLAETGRINQQIMASMLRAAWFPWMTQVPGFHASAARLQRAALDIANKGVAPIHRRAVANAKRLGRSRR